MLPPLIDINNFKQAIEQDRLVITVNQRLQTVIHDAWSTHCALTSTVWYTPRVFSIDNWINELWKELQDQNFSNISDNIVLDDHQIRFYWERAIKISDSGHDLKYASNAARTHKLLQKWLLTTDDIIDDSPSLRIFRKWQNTYKQLLKKNKSITPEDRINKIIDAYGVGNLAKESQINTYGFQSIPPLFEQFLNASSTSLHSVQSQSTNKNMKKIQVNDGDEELRAATTWATSQLLLQPNQRIGIIVPDLNHSIERVARIMDDSLHDQNHTAVVNISAGISLRKAPIVSTAIDLIQCLTSKSSLSEWLHILYSPHCLFDQLPLQMLVNCELELRSSRKSEFNLNDFCFALIPTDMDHESRTLLTPLIRLRDLRREIFPSKQTFTEWAQLFMSTLADLGWPGKRSLDTLEYQQKESWQHLLSKFSSLDSLNTEIGIANAIRQLKQIANDSIFHPKTEEAPIQILGMLEGAGIKFDQLWVTNLDSHHFPPQSKMDSILPVNFQRQHFMPHSNPDRELFLAKQLLSDFTNNAETLVLSHPTMSGDEKLFSSPLITAVYSSSLSELCGDMQPIPRRINNCDQTYLFEDSAPPLSGQETVKIGTLMFKNQSACPFNAFAIHRLKSESLQELTMGLSALERGSILHEVMFKLWKKWGNSNELLHLSDLILQTDISDNITSTLYDWSAHHPILRGKIFSQLEQTRLEKLIWQWIANEKTRPTFAIDSLEVKKKLEVAGIKVAFRIDRIDEVDNKFLIIDYKSGSVNPTDWTGDRPRDPQLPLYVSALTPAVNGCAFAQLKTGNIKFFGLSDSGLIPYEKNHEDWSSLIIKWRDSIDKLAREFVTGRADVKIFHKSNFDFQTDLLPLNRWPEEALINKKLSALKDDL